MSAHVSLNLINKLGKRDKMRGLPSILSLFRKYNKFNNTGVRMLDSINHMTVKLLCNHLNLIFGVKTLGFCHIYVTLLNASSHNVTENL